MGLTQVSGASRLRLNAIVEPDRHPHEQAQATGGSASASDRLASRLTCRNVAASLPPESPDNEGLYK